MSRRGIRNRQPRELVIIEPRPPAADVARRMAERDARLAGDSRTEAQRWLNDPEAGRSALAQRPFARRGAW
jgi:hypothetical protein